MAAGVEEEEKYTVTALAGSFFFTKHDIYLINDRSANRGKSQFYWLFIHQTEHLIQGEQHHS